MQPSRAERIAEIVDRAFDVEVGQRGALLVDLCGEDRELFVEVASLLHFQEKARDFIETPAVETVAEILAGARCGLQPGDALGDYRIVSLLGEGGMGEVYLADDLSLGRKVAIKFLKHGLGTSEIIRRFHQEERILAGLTHPNIAQLYGVAVTPNGVPYFVMEYVDGARLDEYCRDKQLPILRQLELFRKICSAVSYAHQHLVIHRDLKPANIRVTAEGEPKLLDFGIARLLEPGTSEIIEQTMTMIGVMTPDYASPEQVRGEIITTASDIYSLGVVLYEMLTNRKPYKIDNRTPASIARAITDQQPTRPSKVVASASRRRFMDWKPLPQLRGDLDNIILMAMRKEPARRYASVAQLSEDIRRHLAARPVVARKDTVGYRSSKFIARNRIAVSAAAMVVLAIIIGLIVALGQARVARRQRDVAEQERQKAEATKNFLERTIGYSNPLMTGKSGRETTLAEVLDLAVKRLEGGEFANQPEIRAELQQIISQSYSAQGKYQQAQEHIQEVVTLLRRLHGENDPRTIAASAKWAQTLFFRREMAESEKIYRHILPLMSVEQKKGNITAAALADALNDFASLRRTQGDSAGAEALFRQTLKLAPQLATEAPYLIGTTRSTLASTLADQGKFDEALQTAREAAAEYREQRRTDTPDFGFTLTILGGFLSEKKNFIEADANLREAEAILRRHLAPTALWLGDNLRNQAISLYQQQRYADSLNKVTEALKIYREAFGTHYDHYPTALIVHGLVLTKTGKPKEGEKMLRDAVKLRSESLPESHYWVAIANSSLGECLAIQKRYDKAEPLLLRGYDRLKSALGEQHPRTVEASERLVRLYEAWGKPAEAARYRGPVALQ